MKRSATGPPKRPVRPGGPNRTGPQGPTDFIALGQKSRNESQRALPEPSIPSMKKMSTFHVSSASAHESRMSPTIPEPSVKYLDCHPNELFEKVTHAIDDPDTADGLICGAIRNLRANRIKPDQVITVSLMVLAKKYPALFRSESVVDCLVGLLKKDVGLDYIKSKGNSISAILACNLLLAGFDQNFNWPSLLVKVFIEDSLGDRIWVDHPECRRFVKAICTAFDTIPIPREHKTDSGDDAEKKEKEEDVEEEEQPKRFTLTAEAVRVYAVDMMRERVTRRQGTISAQDPTGATSGRHLLKTLTHMCGMSEIRLLAAHKLEMWIQNPKLTKATQDLLLSICINCRKHNQDDVDTIGLLTRMRLKTKALLNHYIQGLKELIDGHKDSVSTLFSYIIYNELSNARNPTNMSVIAALLQHKPKIAAETLAAVCQDLLMQQEDYLRAVRALMREIVRITKHDIDFSSLALGIMKEPDSEKYGRLDQTHKERYVASTADLICLLMLVSTSPSVKEAIPIVLKNPSSAEDGHRDSYQKHKMNLATMQRDAIWWLHATVVPTLQPKMKAPDFVQLIHKVLFLKPAETYYMKDNWPPELERSMLVRHCADVPILEDTIMRLAVIGLSHEHPLSPADTLELISQLVRRAGSLGRPDFNPIPLERRDVIDTLLSLSQYHHPENIKLPSDYVPPSLAISVLYWTAWQTLLLILSFNTATLGLQAWTEYPTLKSFMEMAIVNNFAFPQATIADQTERSQIISKEMQMVEMEKNEIIVFESHLAAATTQLAVTEESSLLLSQLIAMDTRGPPRRPPEVVLNKTQALCNQVQVGASLCRSRNPDFLLDIINRHGEDQAMPWLSGLVGSARGDMSMLPVQCLCEFLMSNEAMKTSQENDIIRQLQRTVQEGQPDECMQVTTYFLRRLHSLQYETRLRAKRAFTLVLAPESNAMEVNDDSGGSEHTISCSWLTDGLTALPSYEFMRPEVLEAILEAVVRESEVDTITSYVTFLASDLDRQDLTPGGITDETTQYVARLALALAHLLIDRQVLIRKALKVSLNNNDEEEESASDKKSQCCVMVEALLKVFLCHLGIAKKHGKNEANETISDEIPWRDTQDEVFLRWPKGGGTAQLHILVSQAMILLLTFGPPSSLTRLQSPELGQDDSYIKMLYTWFDDAGVLLPKAYLMDTQEEALLLHDWLRLRLLHCDLTDLTSRLSLAATRDLDLEQLLVFVQSFGIPYIVMDRLLGILDEFCMSSPEEVMRLTKDNKSYLTLLVEGQWKRGCCNGTNFHALVTMDSSPQRASVIQSTPGVISDIVDLTEDQSGDSDVIMVTSPERPDSKKLEKPVKSEMHVDESAGDILRDLFVTSSGDTQTQKDKQNKFRHLVRVVTTRPSQDSTALTTCVEEIYALLNSESTAPTFIAGMYGNTRWSCSLLRVIDSQITKGIKDKNKKQSMEEVSQVFQKAMTAIGSNAPAGLSPSNALVLLSQSWTSAEVAEPGKSTDELGQLDWARLEEFLRKQLAFLERDDEIKNKVALVAQILLEEIGSRKAQASRGKIDMHSDKFCASIGTTGLLIDWLQLLDPELLAHRPKLQRKLLFESQRFSQTAMPIKMSAKMGSLRPQAVQSHQTYLLSLLTEHSNWETVHKCLQWLLSDAACDISSEKPAKVQSSAINVDARTAMDFFWLCMHNSKIWKGRENKSSALQEPVIYLKADQFCRALWYMVAANSKQNAIVPKNGWNEVPYFDLFLVFYTKFGQKEMKTENLATTVKFIHNKAVELGSDMWWQLLAQLYIFEPFHRVWDELASGTEGAAEQATLAKVVTSVDVGSICQMDALIQMLLDRIGYVKETGRVDTRDSVVAIQSSVDSAYDASLLLKKLASSRPAIVLRQVSLMSVTLSGRTWYEFREFKAKNHLLFMSQLVGVLEAVGLQLFSSEYGEDVDKIFSTFLQMLSNYCSKARRQMKDVTFGTLKLVLMYLQKVPHRAYMVVCPFMYVFQGLLDVTYSDHEYMVSVLQKIMRACEAASFASATASDDGDGLTIDLDAGGETKDNVVQYLKILSRNEDLESIAQVLSDISDTGKRKVQDLRPFLPHLTRLFSTCRDSSIRHASLAAAVACARAYPSCAVSEIVPAYMACLTGNMPTPLQDDGREGTSRSSVVVNKSAASVTENDEVAKTALDFLPDIVVLCREKAPEILQAAFDCGSRSGVGVQPPGASGMIGTPLAIDGNSTWSDLSELLAKSLTLLSG